VTGSEHYTEAERHLNTAYRAENNEWADTELRFAAVHASLANAAAVALAATFEPTDGDTAQAWRRAIQVPPQSVHG